jgi:hypothetical protein
LVSQMPPQKTSSPATKAAVSCTPLRRANGTGTGTGPRRGARIGWRVLVRPFPLIAIVVLNASSNG